MDKPRFLAVGYGSAANRGVEAILRSTLDMFEQTFPDFHMRVLSILDAEQGLRSAIARGGHVTFVPWNRRSWLSKMRGAARALGLARKVDTRGWVLEQISCAAKRSNILIALGGDNYTEDYQMLRTHFYFLEWAFHRNVPAIIWGASIGPFRNKANSALARSILPRVQLICARETITQEYLKSLGATDNVVLVSDPAFTLKPRRLSDNERHRIRNACHQRPVLGLNVSGGIWQYLRATVDRYLGSCRQIVDWFIGEVGGSVILVPHAMWHSKPSVCDHAACQRVFNMVTNKERCIVASPDNDCRQMKSIIGMCDAFIGARTHSTIAALSQSVPTLAISYSNKAKGILRDIMGTESKVIDGRALVDQFDLGQIRRFWDQRRATRRHLEKVMPAYIERAYGANERLKALVSARR